MVAGLEPGVGFVHEMAHGSSPLIYGLQEPFGWLVDATIIEAVDSKRFGHTVCFNEKRMDGKKLILKEKMRSRPSERVGKFGL